MTDLTLADWQSRADSFRPETRLFIDGDYVDAVEGNRFESINPADRSVVAAFSAGNEKDIDRAVAAAKVSFKTGVWSKMAPRDRMNVLYRLADLVDENAKELALMETLDMGKPINDCLTMDIPFVADTFRYFAECIDKIEGSITNTENDVLSLILRQPIGVVGAISPWNFPLLMAAWKVAPALAAGNSTVLKPAEQSPMSCLKLAKLFMEAGGPAGVLNVVPGLGEEAGKALALHMDVSKVSFTGSTEVGKLMLIYAGQSNMKKVSLECGGKSPNIFLGDLVGDKLEQAAEAAAHAIYLNMGEVCSAGSRILVDQKIHGDFLEAFKEKGKDLYKPGNPLDPGCNMGPLVDHQSQDRVLGAVAQAKVEGATLEFGGDTPGGDLSAGAYVNPTLFSGVNNTMTIARAETFGPVASMIPFNGLDEALSIANDSIYGLAAAVWTNDLNLAHQFVRDIEAGTVFVNSYDEGDMTQPFGGFKQSGNAKDKCFESLLSYTQAKAAWFRFS
ncbi:aldehyde dehydrogenase family protein [Aestuariispira insulae]|uniref:Gamma-glutamyl-gamma-aminobutyraldehyde dehydrogenase n=1 Tax=Aestuariispira insulae TaxID=1461337 RepID=A0A3D9H5B5_9PROT|nr:aldehyde dehydrogenase family protein [Aestuariispira insulae]RED44652.1 gamma-glutamyl-gamma-aminobutyraldehyde dehydrogenase [Aestuariispira insulae]